MSFVKAPAHMALLSDAPSPGIPEVGCLDHVQNKICGFWTVKLSCIAFKLFNIIYSFKIYRPFLKYLDILKHSSSGSVSRGFRTQNRADDKGLPIQIFGAAIKSPAKIYIILRNRFVPFKQKWTPDAGKNGGQPSIIQSIFY